MKKLFSAQFCFLKMDADAVNIILLLMLTPSFHFVEAHDLNQTDQSVFTYFHVLVNTELRWWSCLAFPCAEELP